MSWSTALSVVVCSLGASGVLITGIIGFALSYLAHYALGSLLCVEWVVANRILPPESPGHPYVLMEPDCPEIFN